VTEPSIPIHELYPYTDAGLERVKPSEVSAGDLIAHAGPPGAHRYVGDPVTLAGWASYRTSWKEDVYRVEYTSRLDGYARASIDLTAYPVVAVGSVCRRQGTTVAARIFEALIRETGLPLHRFGVKF
jgi:hypothetical protein